MDKLIQSSRFTMWGLIKTYFQSSHRGKAYAFYAVLVLLTISVVGAQLALNYWYNYFYNALQAYEATKAAWLILIFFGIAFIYIVLVLCRYYVWQVYGLRWRRWLTQQLIARWLKSRGYYYLETFDEQTDNPDQRIQDDAGAIVSNSLDLSITLIENILSIIGFSYVLWTISDDEISVPFLFFNLHVHGYLMWIAIIYSLVGTLIAIKIGKPLINLNFEQQRREATFRFAAIDLRSHSETVALYRGEQHQKTILEKLFGSVLENAYAIIVRQTKLLSFTAGFAQTAVALPLLVVLPLYFKKVILLGGLMQSLRAFAQIQESLSFIVNSYSQIAVWRATGKRLTTFLNHLNEVEENAERQRQVKVQLQDKKAIEVKDLDISTPDNVSLLQDINTTFVKGKNYLIKGDSGIGKSTFLRTVAGIWPYAKGEILYPETKKIMFLPQKPYMPIGTLAEAILFPDGRHGQHHEQLQQALRDCHLEQFIPRLQETAAWSEQLSPGEQQRIAFARVLLHKPEWIFMDESTSMLDLKNEKALYAVVKQKLPDAAVISVGHRPSLDAYHDEVIDMTQYSTSQV